MSVAFPTQCLRREIARIKLRGEIVHRLVIVEAVDEVVTGFQVVQGFQGAVEHG